MNQCGLRLARQHFERRVAYVNFRYAVRRTLSTTPKEPNWQDELRSKFRNLAAEVDLPRRTDELRGKADEIKAKAVIGFAELGGKLNHVTGYNEVERLKNEVFVRGEL